MNHAMVSTDKKCPKKENKEEEVIKKHEIKTEFLDNPNPVENPNFDYKDLSTLENHWT